MDWLFSLLPFTLDSAVSHAAAALLCGFIIGWLICFTGVGGGVLVIPTLTFFFSLPVSIAIGTASAYTTITKLMAGAEHIRIKNINYRLFVKLTCAALPGLFLSASVINYVLHQFPESNALVQQVLRWLVIAAILLSLVLIVGGKKSTAASENTLLLLISGFAIGLVMGATGIGGGVLIAPALLLLGKETPKRVVGTSILIALALSGLTAVLYSAGGQLDFSIALWMSAGSLLAIPIASRVLRRVSEAVVQKSLLVIIAAAVLLMLASN
ncbi:MAG: sulfite exporter TauE/SafE family protein [Proteobacteria bacterium]|nr:sulfite exporter TauE/SafE family protein [Pseudomonadota bacterium]